MSEGAAGDEHVCPSPRASLGGAAGIEPDRAEL